jgi:hypothetical protein
MNRVSFGLLTAYAMAAVMLGLAVWLTSDWHWGIRAPLLLYLSLCTLVFPLAKRPADLLVGGMAFGAPIQVTGLVAWLALAAVYAVAWAGGPLFAPIGYFLLRAARATKARAD